jgi:hypothetical protein
MNQIIQGDCLEVMRGLPDNSVDAIVTDPPAGIAFMNKSWDKDKGGRAQWIDWMSKVAAECNRVIKPGGHALVWAIPRTSHWTMTAWEDGGWEPKDKIYHAFGSGFPKSLDVSKAIDKAAGAEREVVGQAIRLGDAKPYERNGVAGVGFSTSETRGNITAPATEAAQQWQGWGSALKPAIEEWCLFRKPSPLTIAETVQEWGTGAINVDGSRISTSDHIENHGRKPTANGWDPRMSGSQTSGQTDGQKLGRWPANLILSDDDEVRGCFPETTRVDTRTTCTSGETAIWGLENKRQTTRPVDNGGSAARFFKSISDTDPEDAEARRIFYCGKATKSDRDEGLEGESNTHCTVKPCELMRYLCRLITPPGGIILDPYMGSGSTGKAAHLEGFQFIGIEKEPEYVEIARARIAAAVQRSERMSLEDRVAWLETQVAAQGSKLRKVEAQQRQMSIFDALGDAS